MRVGGLVFGIVAAVLAASPGRAIDLEPTPVPGLTDAQVQRWEAGRREFERDTLGSLWGAKHQVAVGPTYQGEVSCAGCHGQFGVGGSGRPHHSQIWVHLGWRTSRLDPGNPIPIFRLLQRLTRIQSPQQDQHAVEVPANVQTKSLRKPLRVMGLGYVEAIEDAAILAEAARQQRAGRVSGAAATNSDTGRVARFGSQNRFGTLESFARYADREELSLDYHEVTYAESKDCWNDAGSQALDRCLAPGRHQRLRDFLLFTDFRMDTADAQAWDSQRRSLGSRGGEVFAEIGCTDCHRPVWPTSGPGSTRGVVLYSDLLCHDLGGINSDGITSGLCAPSEWRTALLTNNGWDVHLGYMHDRKASIVEETRFYHQGEAAEHADRWAQLSDRDADALHTFLLSPRTFLADVIAAMR